MLEEQKRGIWADTQGFKAAGMIRLWYECWATIETRRYAYNALYKDLTDRFLSQYKIGVPFEIVKNNHILLRSPSMIVLIKRFPTHSTRLLSVLSSRLLNNLWKLSRVWILRHIIPQLRCHVSTLILNWFEQLLLIYFTAVVVSVHFKQSLLSRLRISLQ